MPKPRISVVLPWCEARGEELLHLEKWVKGQTLPRDEFQVVIAYPDDEPESKAIIEEHLAPGDKVLPGKYPTAIDLWQVALIAADADWVFVSELHCIPAKSTLQDVLAAAEDNGLDAFSVDTGHINKTDVAWMEEQIFHHLTPELRAEGQWNLLRLRGFAIRRDWVHQLGGLKPEYDLYSELILSLELAKAGAKVGLDDRAKVYHVNQETMPLHREDLKRFIDGEMKYRADLPESSWIEYLDIPPELTDLWQSRPSTARRLLKWLTSPEGDRALDQYLSRRTPTLIGSAIFGFFPRILRQTAEWLYWETRFAIASGRTDYRFQLYREQCRSYVELCRAKAFHGCLRSGISENEIEDQTTISPTGFLESKDTHKDTIRWLGFYGSEKYEGNPFRWGTPFCGWSLALGSGDWNVIIDTGGIIDPDNQKTIAAMWNGKTVETSWIDHQKIQVSGLRVTGEKAKWGELLIRATPLSGKPSEEPRDLALPVFSLHFEKQ